MAVRAIGKAVECFHRDKTRRPVFKPRSAKMDTVLIGINARMPFIPTAEARGLYGELWYQAHDGC
jgi:hypothetical protein